MLPRLILVCGLLLTAPATAVVTVETIEPGARLYAADYSGPTAWSLRLGAFFDPDAAASLVASLKQLQQAARTVQTRCPGEASLHHVVIGLFASPRQAQAAPAWQALPGFSIDLVQVTATVDVESMPLSAADCPGSRQAPRNPDDKPASKRFTTSLADRPLTLGGRYTLESTLRKDFRLDRDREDDIVRFGNELRGELDYEINPNLDLFLELRIANNSDVYAEDSDRESESEISRGETWLYWRQIAGSDFGLQLGRINVQETREWWWEDDLDAVRLHYANRRTEANLVLTTTVARVSSLDDGIDPEDRNVLRMLGEWQWQYQSGHSLVAFGLAQHDRSAAPPLDTVIAAADEDEIDTDALWLGLRGIGRWKLGDWGRLYYWADLAMLHGHETEIDFDPVRDSDDLIFVDRRDARDLRGWATDLGAIWQTPWLERSWAALGYAVGSGDDDPDDDVDRAFRQTGLNDNSQRLRGVSRFYYYGEMFRPELSNLRILTAALGWAPDKKSSIDLVYHQYTQVQAVDFVRTTRLRADPNGSSTDLGTELDLIYGREWRDLSFDLALGVFNAGAAYSGQTLQQAWILNLELEYRF